jgi:hypothetical protein
MIRLIGVVGGLEITTFLPHLVNAFFGVFEVVSLR